MQNPYVAILAAAFAAFVFGSVWYMALGKQYQLALGLNPEDCKGKKMPLTPMAVCFMAELLMALVFSILLNALGVMGWFNGAVTGAFMAIGFIIPATITNNIFPGRKPMLSLIDGVHWLGVAAIEGAVLAALR